jgi:hypothetical protein
MLDGLQVSAFPVHRESAHPLQDESVYRAFLKPFSSRHEVEVTMADSGCLEQYVGIGVIRVIWGNQDGMTLLNALGKSLRSRDLDVINFKVSAQVETLAQGHQSWS